jgi:hypothetical protein
VWNGTFESAALLNGAYKLRMTAEIVGPSDTADLYGSAYNPDPGATFQSLLQTEVTIKYYSFLLCARDIQTV